MTQDRHETPMVVRSNHGLERNKSVNVTAIRAARNSADDYVPHLSPGDVKLMVLCASRNLHGEWNAAAITVIIDGSLRENEALGSGHATSNKPSRAQRSCSSRGNPRKEHNVGTGTHEKERYSFVRRY